MSEMERLEAAERIIAGAAQRARRLFEQRAGLEVDHKSVADYVSDADREIEQFVVAELGRFFPEDAIVGEECGGALDAEGSGWVIDPIDGTANFVRGLPMWGISIGYLQHTRSRLGALALPQMNLVLSARDAGGLRVNGSAAPRVEKLGAVRLIGLGENGFEPSAETDARSQALRENGFRVVRLGSAVFSLGSAALGRLDGYIEHGCRLWDIAAAEIICAEAGMLVQSLALGDGYFKIEAQWAPSAAS